MTSLWLRFGYRPWARLLHRLHLHHTRTIGPLGGGGYVEKCEWCGVSRSWGRRQFSACDVRIERTMASGEARTS